MNELAIPSRISEAMVAVASGAGPGGSGIGELAGSLVTIYEASLGLHITLYADLALFTAPADISARCPAPGIAEVIFQNAVSAKFRAAGRRDVFRRNPCESSFS